MVFPMKTLNLSLSLPDMIYRPLSFLLLLFTSNLAVSMKSQLTFCGVNCSAKVQRCPDSHYTGSFRQILDHEAQLRNCEAKLPRPLLN